MYRTFIACYTIHISPSLDGFDQIFSTLFSISGTNDVRGRINVVRAARGRTRIVASVGPNPQNIVTYNKAYYHSVNENEFIAKYSYILANLNNLFLSLHNSSYILAILNTSSYNESYFSPYSSVFKLCFISSGTDGLSIKI